MGWGGFWYNDMEVSNMLGGGGVLVQWYGGLYHVRGVLLHWYNGTDLCTMLGVFWYNGMEVCTKLGFLVQWYGG